MWYSVTYRQTTTLDLKTTGINQLPSPRMLKQVKSHQYVMKAFTGIFWTLLISINGTWSCYFWFIRVVWHVVWRRLTNYTRLPFSMTTIVYPTLPNHWEFTLKKSKLESLRMQWKLLFFQMTSPLLSHRPPPRKYSLNNNDTKDRIHSGVGFVTALKSKSKFPCLITLIWIDKYFATYIIKRRAKYLAS